MGRLCRCPFGGESFLMIKAVRNFWRLALQPCWSAVMICVLSAPALLGADQMILTSASKQFVVRGSPQRSMLASSSKSETVYVDPSLLVVTCEAVKRALAHELGWGERWTGNVYISVHPVRFDNETVGISARRVNGKWNYYLNMPDELPRRELLESIVAVLLAEFADRSSKENSVELPPWLAEGLTAHLMQGPLAGAAMQAHTLTEIRDDPQLMAARTVRHIDIDQALRQAVQRHGALTFDGLNWPDFDETNAPAADAYHYSSHLFVRELLRLRGGSDSLCATLAMLPEHLNWQTAFLRGFEAHFTRMLDVEKWWSLTLMRIKTRDNTVTWSTAEARMQLEEILYTAMQVRITGDDAAHTAPVALQTVIHDWGFEQQTALLQRKLIQLQAARLRLPSEYAQLSEAYRLTVEKYLQTRGSAWFAATERAAAERAVNELNALDALREKLMGKMATAKVSLPLDTNR
jgi:hypothetical protein